MAENVFLFVPNLIGYVRILSAFASFYYMPFSPLVAVSLYLLSEFLDAIDGHAARMLGQASKFGAVLDMVTDRCCTTCLMVTLSTLYPRYQVVFQFLIFLDITSHWAQMYSVMMKGGGSHKATSIEDHPLMRIYYTSRVVLFCMCAGNEVFLAMLYLQFFGTGPLITIGTFQVGLWKLICWSVSPIFFLKNVINVIQMAGAFNRIAEVDIEERSKGK